MSEPPVRLLLVCLGNICRSPTAEGVMRKLIAARGWDARFEVDSAGTHAYHVGEPPDPRAVRAAKLRGIEIDALRARAVEIADFAGFDYLLAMDTDNLAHLEAMRPHDARAEVHLMLSWSLKAQGQSVPDPYYGGDAGFERVLDLLEEAGEAFLDALARERDWPPPDERA